MPKQQIVVWISAKSIAWHHEDCCGFHTVKKKDIWATLNGELQPGGKEDNVYKACSSLSTQLSEISTSLNNTQ